MKTQGHRPAECARDGRDTDAESVYANYHTTLAADGGLTRVRWRATRLAFPELKPLLRTASPLPSYSVVQSNASAAGETGQNRPR